MATVSGGMAERGRGRGRKENEKDREQFFIAKWLRKENIAGCKMRQMMSPGRKGM